MRIAIASIALVLALAVAGCGSDEKSETAENPTNARGVPITPGGDNTIQGYGREGSRQERRQVAATLTAYVAARGAGDWAKACELMSEDLRAELRSIAAKSRTLENAPCSAVANLVVANLPKRSSKPPPEGAPPDLVSLRVKGPDAIAIYTAEGEFYYLPFDRDEGAWKVSDLNGEALLE